jgi:hypothetical protein
MTRARPVLWLTLLGVTAVLCASCAPEAPPLPPKGKAEEVKIRPPDRLQERIAMAVELVGKRKLRADHGFWTVFHAILGLGPDTVKLVDTKGNVVNAFQHVCDGGEIPGMTFVPTANGVDVINGEMFFSQGHQDQFVAEMVQWGVPANRVIKVQGKDYPFQKFIDHSKMRARVGQGQELSWAIVIIGQHFGTKCSWTNEKGEKLRFEDLVEDEVKASIIEAACGGTHRLFGLTWAYHRHLRDGGKTEGVWRLVADRIAEHKAKAKEFRNGDGSFSTSFFRGRGNSPDMKERITTTGHILEWLALAMTEEELRAPWVEDAVFALTKMIFDIQQREMEGGALYHAVHGLLLYYARLYDGSRLGTMQPHMVLPTDGPPWKMH